MKRNIVLPIAAIVIAFVGLFSSCKKTGNSTKIEFDSIVVAEKIPLLVENDTTLPYSDVEIKFIYPKKFQGKEELARLQEIFAGTFFRSPDFETLAPQESVNKYLADYSEEYKKLSNSYYEDKKRLQDEIPQWYWYKMSNTNKIIYQGDSLLAYAVEYSDYTGGAHGSYNVVYTNIDLNRLVTLAEEDLFKPDYFKPLTEKIIQNLMKKFNVTQPDSLYEHGFFTIEDIAPNNNFWLDDKAIHYAYNQYEIAPYAMGVIEVSVPYSDLEDILIPNGLVSRFFLKEK